MGWKRRIVITAAALVCLAATGIGQEPENLWFNGGIEGNRVDFTKDLLAGARKVIVSSRYSIRAWKSYDKKGLWSVRVADCFGATGLSPDTTMLAHGGSEDSTWKVFLRRTSDGSLIESFPYDFASGTVYVAVASNTKIYLYHGLYVDEIVKEGNAWNRTWRWTMTYSGLNPNGNRIILHKDKRWLFVSRDDNDVAVLDTVNKGPTPTTVLDPPTNIRDMSMNDQGTKLAVATTSTLYQYNIPSWTVAASWATTNARGVEWHADGNLAILSKVSGGIKLQKYSAAGALLGSSSQFPTNNDYTTWGLATAIDGKSLFWDGEAYRMLQPTYADQGILAPTARITRLAAPVDDKQIFAGDDEGNIIGYDSSTGLRTRQFFLPGQLIHGLSAGSGKVAISTNNQIVIWNPANGTSQTLAQGTNYGQDGYHVLHVSRSVITSIGAPALAAASGTNIYIYNLNTGGGYRVLNAGSDVRHVQFSGGGSHIMALTSNDQLIVWPTNDWAAPVTINDVDWSCGAIDQGGTRIIVGKYTGGVARYQRSGSQWTFQQAIPLTSSNHQPRQVRFFKDGSKFVVTSTNGGTSSMVEIVNTLPMSINMAYPVEGNATALAVADSQQSIFFSAGYLSYEDGYFRGIWNPFRVAAPWSMDLAPATVKGGNSSTGRVFLSKPAPPGGLTVTLASTFPGVANPQSQIVIPAGAKIGSFNITTTVQSAIKKVTLTATANGRTSSVVINVTP